MFHALKKQIDKIEALSIIKIIILRSDFFKEINRFKEFFPNSRFSAILCNFDIDVQINGYFGWDNITNTFDTFCDSGIIRIQRVDEDSRKIMEFS